MTKPRPLGNNARKVVETCVMDLADAGERLKHLLCAIRDGKHLVAMHEGAEVQRILKDVHTALALALMGEYEVEMIWLHNDDDT